MKVKKLLVGRKTKTGCASAHPVLFRLSKGDGLLTQAKSLDDGAVTVDVALIQIVEQCAALAYQ